MPRFDYIAVNSTGQKLSGQADGTDSATVSEELSREGWTVLSIQLAPVPGSPLSESEGVAATQQILTATQSGLPLAGALRAFCDEVSSDRLRRRLVPVCEALERGQTLDKHLLNSILGLSPQLAMILNSGLPTATMSGMLLHAIESELAARDLKSRVAVLLSYPLAIFIAVAGLWVFLLVYITPMLDQVVRQFGVQTAPSLDYLAKLSQLITELSWWWVFGGLIAGVVAAMCGFRAVSPVVRSQIWNSIPFIGSMYRMLALSDLAQVLALMLECRVPLPRAFTWAANGSRDADLARLCGEVSQRIQAGDSVETILGGQIHLPAYMEQILRWAERGQDGSEPLKSLSRMLRQRAKMLAESTMPLLEPIMLCGSVVAVIGYVAAILPPLIKLLNDLS